jgi:outer membrane protein
MIRSERMKFSGKPARRRCISAGWGALLVAAGVVLGAPEALEGQDPGSDDAPVLTLAEALAMARRNNPSFRSQQNDEDVAEWEVREAYGQLLLPGASASVGATYEGAGTQTFGALVSAGSTDFYRSSYYYGLNYSISPASFTGLSAARADRRAAGARTDAAAFSLESSVTRQYLAALRARDEVRVSQRALDRSEQTFLLARVRVEAGAAAPTDGKQAEVDRGRAEVALLQARNALAAEKLRLVEQVGVVPAGDFDLEDAFDVRPVEMDVDELIRISLSAHPQLEALRASERARDAGVWSARSQYLPSLNIQAGWSGFTRQVGDEDFLLSQERNSARNRFDSCNQLNLISGGLNSPLPGFPRNCDSLLLTAEDESRIVSGNRVFPGNFTRQPFVLQARVSIPIFGGFTEQRQVGQARAAAEDAREARRAEELRLRTAVTSAYGDLTTQYRIVAIEERNVAVAQEQVELARERYRLGAAPFLELMEAESSLVTAERGYLNAVYSYLQARAALEEAVGARLNTP